MKHAPFILCFLIPLGLFSQPTQTVRGTITDGSNNLPLPGATVSVYQNDSLISGAGTDIDGNYRIESLAVGRYRVVATYIGYESQVRSDVVLTSARQEIINFTLQESVNTMEEVVVKAYSYKGAALNDLSMVSARAFSIDETDRYAGSRGDPARMASNYAGVSGNNDQTNDIVIRGNSPMGLLWRIDDVNIPNPNHFAEAGSSGGPVGILNNQVLSNSDFYTGAFPAEYGNTISGVFDLNMRAGNDENHEFSGQLGILGLGALAEGPISKNQGSSYLATYRYSSLALFNNFGLDIGTDAIPYYQDGAVKLNFPISAKTNISLFGIGGLSKVDIIKSDDRDTNSTGTYGDQESDEYFRTRMGFGALGITQSLGKHAYARFTLSTSTEYSANNIYKIYRHIEGDHYVLDSLQLTNGFRFLQGKHELSGRIHHQLGTRHKVIYGIYLDRYDFNFIDSIRIPGTNRFTLRLNHKGNNWLTQPFIQWHWRANENLTITAGLHSQHFDLNNAFAIEPRFGGKYRLNHKSSVHFGTGRHSQILPTYIYFTGNYNTSIPSLINNDLDFIKSDHFIAGYEQYIGKHWRLVFEAYYQRLFSVPVSVIPSSYSILNEGSQLNRFFPDKLENTGTGQNKGVEITIERFFSNDYVFLFSGSLYDAKYQGSNGITYNSAFNSNFVINSLGTKEWHLGKKNRSTISTGAKITWAGGKRFTPFDPEASAAAGFEVLIDSLRNERITHNYFRFDLRVEYRLNANKLTHHFGLDIVNVFDTDNIYKLQYSPGNKQYSKEKQLGRLPIFYYRIDI